MVVVVVTALVVVAHTVLATPVVQAAVVAAAVVASAVVAAAVVAAAVVAAAVVAAAVVAAAVVAAAVVAERQALVVCYNQIVGKSETATATCPQVKEQAVLKKPQLPVQVVAQSWPAQRGAQRAATSPQQLPATQLQ